MSEEIPVKILVVDDRPENLFSMQDARNLIRVAAVRHNGIFSEP